MKQRAFETNSAHGHKQSQNTTTINLKDISSPQPGIKYFSLTNKITITPLVLACNFLKQKSEKLLVYLIHTEVTLLKS